MVHTRDCMTCNLVRIIIVNSAIILAGGSGSRIESGIPKQFLTLSNKPIIEYSIDMFEKNTNIDEIILSYTKNELSTLDSCFTVKWMKENDFRGGVWG